MLQREQEQTISVDVAGTAIIINDVECDPTFIVVRDYHLNRYMHIEFRKGEGLDELEPGHFVVERELNGEFVEVRRALRAIPDCR